MARASGEAVEVLGGAALLVGEVAVGARMGMAEASRVAAISAEKRLSSGPQLALVELSESSTGAPEGSPASGKMGNSLSGTCESA